jgi:hypothetical protein
VPRPSRSTDLHDRLARLGAQARLDELRREEAAIRTAYPDLFSRRGGRPPSATAAAGGGKRRRMSAAARKAVSERMRRYWAERRKKAGRS